MVVALDFFIYSPAYKQMPIFIYKHLLKAIAADAHLRLLAKKHWILIFVIKPKKKKKNLLS